MATVLIRTIAGASYDKAVRDGVEPADPIRYILLLGGDPVTSIPDIVALNNVPGKELHRFSRLSATNAGFIITEESALISRYEAHLPESIAFDEPITSVALLRESGALFAYAPYFPTQGGVRKTVGFIYLLNVVVVEQVEGADINFGYYPFDYMAMSDRLMAKVDETLISHCNIRLAPLDAPAKCED